MSKMSFSRSTPGAISVSTTPLLLSSKTALSVIYNTGWATSTAYSPLNVICSTALMNLLVLPSDYI